MQVTALLLRREPDATDHYQVYAGERRVGTIYRTTNLIETHAWFWALNGDYAGPQPMSGHAGSRDAAMAAVRAAWDRWGDGSPTRK